MTSLYNKYRPKTFAEVVGQKEAVSQLVAMGKAGKVPHAILLSGPSGCLRGDSLVYDPLDGSEKTIRQRWEEGLSFHVLSLNEAGEAVVATALPPVRYPRTRMFRVETDEQVFYVTGEHRLCLYSSGEYLSVRECERRIQQGGEVHLLSSSEFSRITQQLNGFRCLQRERGSLVDCPVDSHFCGEQPPFSLEAGQGLLPSRVGVPRHIGRFYEHASTLSSTAGRPSKLGFYPHAPQRALGASLCLSDEGIVGLPSFRDRVPPSVGFLTFPSNRDGRSTGLALESALALGQKHRQGFSGIRLLALEPPVVGSSPCGWSSINSIEEAGQEEYFDFHVPLYNNYWMGGIFHHNCGKTTIARILRTKLKCSDNDFVEINATNFKGIDTIRTIQQQVGLAPLGGTSRVWLIDEFHQVTSQAEDALLKILEDTPDHVYFFLATTETGKIKKTILTRCTEIRCKAVGLADLKGLAANVAGQEGIELSTDVTDRIAEVADGSARKALVILEAVIGIEDKDEQLAAIEAGDVKGQAIEIARCLMNPSTKWPKLAAILKSVDDEPEGLRHMVLSYAKSCLLGSGNHERAALIIDEFSRNFYDSKHAGLAAACYQVVKSK